jgi:hypothetical protein
MTRNLVLAIIGCALLSLVFAAICYLAFPGLLPYVATDDDATSWRPQIAFLTTASALPWIALAAILAALLAARLWNRSTRPAPAADENRK